MCSQKEIQAALSLNPIAEGAQEFYLTEYAIKVSKILRIPCYFDPCCSKIGLNLIRTFTLNGSNSGDSRVKFFAGYSRNLLQLSLVIHLLCRV